MRAKRKSLILCILVLCSLCLAACTSKKPPAVRHNPDPLWETELEGVNPEFVEDYIYLWDLLENEYPFLAAAERITGKDAQEIKEKYYHEIPKYNTAQDFSYFVVGRCLNEFASTGHLAVIPDWFYSNLYTNYAGDMDFTESNPRSLYNFSQLTAPKTLTLYAKALEEAEKRLETAEENKNDSSSNQLSNVSDNLSFSYYKEQSAGYVNINSMTYYSPSKSTDNPEYHALEEFFITLESEGYEHCVIDIRNNGGGSNMYWMDMLVAPNIEESLTEKSAYLVKGELSSYYVGQLSGLDLRPVNEKQWTDYTDLNQDDLEIADHYTFMTRVISPHEGKPLFTGKFWLLVGGRCYSSSESFLQFSQATGFATLVGSNTGGDGGGIDPISVSLPNTGVLIRFSTMLGLNPDGSCNEEFGTTPDYPIAPGEDALDKCLEIISKK